MIPPVDGHRVAAGLTTRALGRALRCLGTVTSTNDVALGEAAAGLAVVAEEQTLGRGRGGSRWESPRGAGVLLSVVVIPPGLGASPARVVFAAAVAVCGALRAHGAAAAHIKWPNDVLVGRRKIAGILCESRARGAFTDTLVVGIGINLHQTVDELPPQATSLALLGFPEVSREVLIADVLNRLEPELDLVAAGRWDELRQRWESMSPWSRAHGLYVPEQDVRGVSDGIDGDGCLRVARPDGTILRLRSGGVAFDDTNAIPGA